jgi:hypothetical protein
MTQEGFKKILDRRKYSYEEKGSKIIVTHDGNIELGYLTTLAKGVTFSSNNLAVQLYSLKVLPEDVEFFNRDSVYLDRLKNLPKGVIFSNKKWITLRSVTSLPEEMIFSNGESIILTSLTTIPKGVIFSNDGFVQLGYKNKAGHYLAFGPNQWEGNIKGINDKKLFNRMIELGLFDRK